MKIVNHTPFATARLREIAQRVAEQELDSNQRGGITVHFTVSGSRTKDAYQSRRLGYYVRQKGPAVPGLAFNQAIVTIRKTRALHCGDCAKRHAAYAAHDLAHEFAEMQGYHHEQLKSPRYFYRKGWEEFYQWADELPLIPKAKPAKPERSEVIKAKLENAQVRLIKARTREKRATTIRKKWTAKVKYYEKKLEQANVQPQTESTPEQKRDSDTAAETPSAV